MTNSQQIIENAHHLITKKLYVLAHEQVSEALVSSPNDPNLLFTLSQIYYEYKDYLAAAKSLEDILRIDPDNPDILHKAALNHTLSGNTVRGEELAKKFLTLSNYSPQAWQLLANIYEKTGRIDEAKDSISHVPDTDHYFEANINVKSKLHYAEKEYDQAIDLLKKYQEWAIESKKKNLGSDDTMYIDLMFQLVKIYNKVGDYDKAWETAVLAHELADQKWDQDKFDSQHEYFKEVFTKENLRALAHAEDPFDQPVFVVGNARSGTSLLEQILSMHPDVGNGGELLATGSLQRRLPSLTDSFHKYPDCIFDMTVEDANACAASYREATKWFSIGKKRVTNKAIGLQAQVGFLSLIMPKSRYIMLHRHVLDNCLSCFTTNLVHSGHSYTSTLESLGRTWVTRRKMQDYWSEVIESPVMNLHYDKLVVDQEGETRRLIEFLDLPWNDDCLQFHKSRRVAATISYDQVNQKMYTSSSGRWKNYEKHLGPLIDIVGDYL